MVGIVTAVLHSRAGCFLRQHDRTQRLAGMGEEGQPVKSISTFFRKYTDK